MLGCISLSLSLLSILEFILSYIRSNFFKSLITGVGLYVLDFGQLLKKQNALPAYIQKYGVCLVLVLYISCLYQVSYY